jgi:uncharacterized repeat protein (TIGR03803 family)
MNYVQATGESLGGVCAALLLALMALAVAGTAIPAQAQYSALYDFTGPPSASEGAGTVAQGRDGNLYGASHTGGQYNNGTIYEMSPSGGPPTVLYSFSTRDDCGLGLTLGTDGNFYGACAQGGTSGVGYVFQVTPPPSVTFSVLYSFCSQPHCNDGATPSSRPIEAADGNYYGTTFTGGANDRGTVYQITPTGTNVLYSFSEGNVSYPYGPLLLGSNGNLYGTTEAGTALLPPPPNFGAVYEITTAGELTVLHIFAGGPSDGATPTRGVIQGSDGNFYGTTIQGGIRNVGTIFKMTPAGKVTLLHSFATEVYGYPRGLAQASNGNFYGDANDCTSECKDKGSLFEITPKGKFSITHKFEGPDGAHPDSALSNTNGILYGVTEVGGTHNDGVFYDSQVSEAPEFCRPQVILGQENTQTEILGQGFKSSSVVKFGGVTATFVLTGTTFITATVPVGALTGPLTVKTGSTRLTSRQPFYVLPTITTFTPPTGPIGTPVTITGTGLTQTTKVMFGNINAKEFTVDSDQEVTAIVPAGATKAPIYITTKGGTAVSESEFTVTN